MLDEEKNFYLKGNQDFNDRQKSIFQAVDQLSSQNPDNRYSGDDLKVSKVAVIKDKKDLKQFVGQESIFKRPEATLKKYMKLKIPEFIKNPQKWKKYTLGNDEISEQSNRMVAMSFLKDLRERSKTESVDAATENLKPKFNKFIKESGSDLAVSVKDEKSTFINGKTIMPEYVVGQKMKPKVRKKSNEITSNSCVKLEHLLDEE